VEAGLPDAALHRLAPDPAELLALLRGEAVHAPLRLTLPGQARVPLLSLLFSQPLPPAGGPAEEEERMEGGWPWEALLDRLRHALLRTGRALRIEAHPATWQRALQVFPGSHFVVLFCPGGPDALIFEEELTGRPHPLSPDLAQELPALLPRGARPPQAVLLLCDGSAAAAAALHRAGVPLCLGVDEAEALPREAALSLCVDFVAALAAGADAGAALQTARRASPRADALRIFSRGRGRGAADRGALLSLPLSPAGAPGSAPQRGWPGWPGWLALRPTPSFVGREAELAQLLHLLSPPGLVLLSGAPGIGKTELLRALLSRCHLARWPAAGSALLDLRGCRSAEDVRRAAGQQGGGAWAAPERLLLIDHPEAALFDAGARAALRELLDACAEAHVVLSTSEVPAFLPPLPHLRLCRLRPAAGRALRTRLAPPGPSIPDLDPGPGPGPGEDALEAALDAALDGHPLAITLAAARLAEGLPPAALLRLLKEQGEPGDPATESSLRAALSPSLARLPEAALELGRGLGLLPGGLPAGAQLPPREAEALRALVRHGLAELREGGYEVPGPIAAHLARLCRDEGGGDGDVQGEALRRSAAQALLGELRGQQALLGTGQARQAVRALRRWAPALAALLGAGGPPGWLAGLPPQGLAAAALCDAATGLAAYAGETDTALRWGQGALGLLDGRCDEAALAPLRLRLGWLHLRASADPEDVEAARSQAMLVLGMARRTPLRWGQALLLLGGVAEAAGQGARARARYDEAHTRLQAAAAAAADGTDEARRSMAWALLRRSELDLLLCAPAPSAPAAEARRCFAQLGDGRGEARAAICQGEIALRAGAAAQARDLFLFALRGARRITHPGTEARALLALAGAALRAGDGPGGEEDLGEARCRLSEALAILARIGDRAGAARAAHLVRAVTG
jgi:hypothetical protein